MMAAYFADRAGGLAVVGLGNTSLVPQPAGASPNGGRADPWTHVLTTRPQPVATPRAPLWANARLPLAAAPALDVTTYGRGWYPPEDDGPGVFAWTLGAGRAGGDQPRRRPARARLSMEVASHGRPRMLILSPRGGPRTAAAARRRR